MVENKTKVEDIERGIYDIIEKEDHKFTTNQGLTEEVVRAISKEKNEPQKAIRYLNEAAMIFKELEDEKNYTAIMLTIKELKGEDEI